MEDSLVLSESSSRGIFINSSQPDWDEKGRSNHPLCLCIYLPPTETMTENGWTDADRLGEQRGGRERADNAFLTQGGSIQRFCLAVTVAALFKESPLQA